MATVAIRGVDKAYGAVSALHDVSFEIDDGEFVALVGPSGCGKSTLLRIIAGLETTNRGTILIGGEVVDDWTPKARNVAMVFQSYALYPHMTVADNMGFALRLRGLDRAAIAEKVDATSRMLGLEELLARYPAQLSGGQKQRVAMAGRSCAIPACSCSTSPSPTSTRSSGFSSVPRSRSSISGSGRRRSTSPTTRSRP